MRFILQRFHSAFFKDIIINLFLCLDIIRSGTEIKEGDGKTINASDLLFPMTQNSFYSVTHNETQHVLSVCMFYVLYSVKF